MQVDVGDVAAEFAGRGDAHQGIEVGPVDIDLAAGGVDAGADLGHRLLEHAVGRGVGEHERRQPVVVRGDGVVEVGEIDVAVAIAAHHHHPQAGHLRAGRIGAVGGGRDQADIAVFRAAAGVIGADRQQPGVFTLGAGIGLQRYGGKAGALGQPALQIGEQLRIPGGLLRWSERMQIGEFRPADRQHFRAGVEFHGAGAEWNHAVHQAEVAALQALEIAHHFRFAVIAVEGRMGEDGILAAQSFGQAVGLAGETGHGFRGLRRAAGKGREHPRHQFRRDGFIEADGDPVGAEWAQIDPVGARAREDRLLRATDGHRDRVEPGVVARWETEAAKPGGERVGERVDPIGDAAQSVRPVIDRIAGGDHGQQHLRSTDVGVGLFAADVLLAGLQRHAQCGLAAAIHGDADDAPRRGALVRVAKGEVGRVWTAETHGHAETLAGADHDVGAQGAGRAQQHQGERIGGDYRHSPAGVDGRDPGLDIVHRAVAAGILEQGAEAIALAEFRLGIAHHQLEAEVRGAGGQYREGLRQALVGSEKPVGRMIAAQASRHGHGFGGGSRFIQQRGVRQLHAGQIHDQLLEIEQGFQAALGDFRLIGRVGGVPARIFQHIAADHRGQDGAVVAQSEQRSEYLVAFGKGAQLGQRHALGAGLGQLRRMSQVNAFGQDGGHEIIEVGGAQRRQLRAQLVSARAQVAVEKAVGVVQFSEIECRSHCRCL